MGALKGAILLLSLAWAAPAPARPLDRWATEIAEASRRFGVQESWIIRVMAAESGGRTMQRGRPIESPAGAMGLMQLMPGTWREMRAAHGLGGNPHDPRDNILAGTAYLRAMYERFGYPGLFAAYNAGPARYARHLASGRPLPAETIAYVATVAPRAGRPDAAEARLDSRPLFVSLEWASPSASAPPAVPPGATLEPAPSGGLFVRLGDAEEAR